MTPLEPGAGMGRVQRSRTKGWRMPPGAVYVGRPSLWGNPFPITGEWIERLTERLGYPSTETWTRAVAVGLYRWWMAGTPVVAAVLPLGAAATDARDLDMQMTEGTKGGAVWVPRLGVIETPKRPDLTPLRGKTLVCWCNPNDPLQACHADVLSELAG